MNAAVPPNTDTAMLSARPSPVASARFGKHVADSGQDRPLVHRNHHAEHELIDKQCRQARRCVDQREHRPGQHEQQHRRGTQEPSRPHTIDEMPEHRDQHPGRDSAHHRRGETGGLRQMQRAHRIHGRIDQQRVGADGGQRDQRARSECLLRMFGDDIAERRAGGFMRPPMLRRIGDAGAQHVAHRPDQQPEQERHAPTPRSSRLGTEPVRYDACRQRAPSAMNRLEEA